MVEEGCSVVVNQGGDQEVVDLPPGFRFHPTDEEIITHYLKEKVFNIRFTAAAIGQADLNKNEPWDLPKMAKMGEKEFYFFCQRDRKYPTGMRTNRATVSGYWKATGKDKEIFRGKGCLVGMKKTLVFYTGRAPKGEKTNWVMHEYRLDGKYSYHNLPKTARDEWVVCRVFHKNAPPTTTVIAPNHISRIDSLDNIDHFLDFSSLPPLIDPGFLSQPSPSFSGAGHDLKPVLHHPTTALVPTQTLNFPYHSGNNFRSDSGYGAGSDNNNKGMIKLENSLVSGSQETGLSTDVNTTATPEISSYPLMMNPAADAALMMDGSKSACDDLDDLIFWDDDFYSK
ncbi:hypothetical protein CARUB_v10014118mg [Capsella rubella]|uniref:NAC domain-containing protein n=1 Tax=Capsella rubella TaxID=81985 RepID=R0G5Z5_9BRAS|nr:NAC domain-containing protein 46 [Capsella rubella]EOA30972.1 hypothetical protein CARUB_v10014118mg [Capsella rubella]